MSERDFGGRVTVRLSTGEVFSLRGTYTMDTAGQSNEAVTNQDGSVARVGTPKARTCEVSLEDGGINYDKLLKAKRFNVAIVEDFTGVTHHFTGAFIVGTPSQNRMTGEVTGLSFASDGYVRTDA